ncbi:APHP domain protein [Methanobacterium lacus]|uniref:APHP domain protein n=1 Tax=Methanobacterium lacus (strain AL-21) TaxID=877455 RepID=F0TA77_METLA|nr:CARDB domain-containing protein [Methanobacterium lacus]ADZ10027.1 APHP domain protein [Methanobacterium lacus]
MNSKNWLKSALITMLSLSFVLCFVPFSSAHILIIGDSHSDIPDAYSETKSVASLLKSKGYQVYEVYRNNATTKNILKGMYGADAIIYAGHGGYKSENYDSNGGSASAPFALVGSNDFIWGIGNKMREGWNGKLFSAPIKNNIPVLILQSCFSTGWVDNKEVANPTATVYNFARMFTGTGANYYATSWIGADFVKDLINGAKNFKEANKLNYDPITKSTVYKNTTIWRNNHGYSAFIGNWLGTFPKANKTTKYNDAAAEAWYNSDRSKNPFQPDLTVTNVINPKVGLIGHTFSTTAVIKNIANASSSGFYVSFYLKHDPNNKLVYLGKSFVSSLAGNSIRYVKKTVTLPSKISSGNYYIAAYVDSDETNAESNENNNYKKSSYKTQITHPFKDLLSSNLNATILNKKLLVSNTVKNRGNTKTDSFYVNYYLKKNGQTGLGTYVGHKYFDGLSSGKSVSHNIQFTLKKSYSSDYKIVSYIDPQIKIKESNRTNNIQISSIKLSH